MTTPAPVEIAVGDRVRDCRPWPNPREFRVIALTTRWSNKECNYLPAVSLGRGVKADLCVFIHNIHTDGKPRRSGWVRVP